MSDDTRVGTGDTGDATSGGGPALDHAPGSSVAPGQSSASTSGPTSDGAPDRPPLRLVRGDASPEEVAALLAVLSAASTGEAEPAPRHTSHWSSPARAVRRPLSPGPDAWRASAWR